MPPRRSVEQLYADAFALAEAGKQACDTPEGDRLAAERNFQEAIAILSRLAIVESAAKRALVMDAVVGLKERLQQLQSSSDYLLARAMDEHAQAQTFERQQADRTACVERYITAGDWYMKALEALPLEDLSSRAAVKDQLEYIIDYVSRLKVSTDMEAAAEAPASALESTASCPDAVTSLHWPEPPSIPKAASEAKHTVVMEISTAADAAAEEAKPPPQGAAYTPQELDVLRRSSLINGHVFVPWLDDLDSHEPFDLPTLFKDPDGLVPLSAKQIKKQAIWHRPSEYALVCGRSPVMIATISAQVVKQDIVTDCSFVASLCIAAAYEQRFQKRLITNIIFPVDATTQQPVYNPAGKYVVKLWANGVPRKVVIDDLLPVSSTTGKLLCSCTTQLNELWVSLIEKAYLKLHGGYDFPGGNSGIDLFALTGWIPERLAIHDLVQDAEKEDRMWEQLKSAFHYGDCIITMSTGELSKDQTKTIGLVPTHVYAVLNVYEQTDAHNDTKKTRLLQVKNPWRKQSWKGPFSDQDTAHWQSPLGQELREYERQLNGSCDDQNADDGQFWIDLESVKKYFESMYLNWNPSLFPFKDVYHDHWPVELGPSNDSVTLGFNPQYALTFSQPEASGSSATTVWVLLSRHVRSVERDMDLAAQQFLTLHVYGNTKGRRVFDNQDALSRGTYSNNQHTLVSLEVDFTSDSTPSFTLVASQYEKFTSLDYTLSIFSTSPFECHRIAQVATPENTLLVRGRWDGHTAGGRPYYATFMNNPQFHVRVPHNIEPISRRLYVFLEDDSFSCRRESVTTLMTTEPPPGIPMNLRAALHTTERLCGLPSASSAMSIVSSGEYRPGFCYLELKLPPSLSDLVLIPSTFEAGVRGAFALKLVLDPTPEAPLEVKALAPEGYGMEAIELRGKWDAQKGTSAGCASYGCYTFNPKFLVQVTTECELFARLQSVAASSSQTEGGPPSLNVSIFACPSSGSLLLSTNPTTNAFAGRATSDGGAYVHGNPCGVRTELGVRFPPGWYVIVPSTYDPQEHAFLLRVYSSQRVTLREL